VLGSLKIQVSHNSQTKHLSLLVVKGQEPSLLGRDWMNWLILDWQTIHFVQTQVFEELLQKHSALFQDELGKLQGVKVKLYVNTDMHPKFCKAIPVPLALQRKVEAASNNLGLKV